MERSFSERHAREKILPEKSCSLKEPKFNINLNFESDLETTKAELLEKVNVVDEKIKGGEENNEQTEEPPPEIQYTLENVSPDIDEFLATFSTGENKKETIVEEKGEDGEKEEKDAEKEEKDAEKDEEKDEEKEEEKDKAKEEEKDEAKEEEKEEEKDVEKDKEKSIHVEIPVFVDKFLDLVDELIAEHESIEGKGKWGTAPESDTSFLQVVNRIHKLSTSLEQLRSDPNHGVMVNRLGSIQQRAMTYLEDQFRLLLEEAKGFEPETPKSDAKGKQPDADQGSPQDSEESKEAEDYFIGYPDDVVSNLNSISREMIQGGYDMECYQVYMMVRAHAFEKCFSKIGFEKISIDEVQKMQWEALEREIPLWIKAVKDCATIYFSKERNLAEAVFLDFPSISATLFGNLTRGVVIQILNFAEGVAMTKRSAEKLFKFLDMYEALRDSLPAIGVLFSEEYENELKTETTTARCRIGETAICIFCDLENSIKSDTSRTPVPGGAVHPLTRYTMNYLKLCCEYKATLEQVFRDHSKIERADSTSRPRYEGETQNYSNKIAQQENQSPFACQLIRIMDLLDSNLEAKSRLYRDVALSCIFMMNNGRYILQKIKGAAEIHQVMGDTWCRKKTSDLRNYHKNYKVEAWSKLLACLAQDGLAVNGKVTKPVLKERFKNFNALFDEIHKTQSTWVVSDEQLQSELRVSISAVVTPAYRSFLGRFSQYFDPGRQYEKYIKFQPEDIENYIDELFDGNTRTMARKRQ